MTLPGAVVRRALPVLRSPNDALLFTAEAERSLPEVSTQTVSGEFYPTGWHADLGGWKGLVKGTFTRLTTLPVAFSARPGRRPLIATDRFTNGYFHWVTETLPRLWWLKSDLAALELLLPAFAPQFPYMTESLAVFPDLAHRTLEVGTRWRLDRAVRVPPLALTGNYRPELMSGLGEAWRAIAGAGAPRRKLYVSRSKAARRRIANEAALRMVLEPQGFETVHLEGRDFADQVRLLAGTTHLISNHGAGLTNMIFMVPGARVTEIRLRGDAHNNCYFSLARALGLDYDYRLADPVTAGEDAHTADVLVDPREFA